MQRLGIIAFLLAATALLHPGPVVAQSYPAKTIRIVVGQTPGGQSDHLARLVGREFEQLWQNPVVIENRAGAGGTIGADLVAQSPADGYTLLFAGSSNLVIAPAIGTPLRYSPTSDFTPLGRVARVPLVLVVNPAIGASTIAQLIAVARAHPGKLTYGSVGSGAMTRLAVEWLKASAKIDILEVPYKGVAPALSDLLAGRIDMMFFDLAFIAPHVKAGALLLVAGAGSRRAAGAPDLPSVAEQGIEGFAVEPWYGLVAPARTPADIVDKLRAGLAEVRRQPEFQQRLRESGYEPINDSAQQFAADLLADIDMYSALIKSAGIKGEP